LHVWKTVLEFYEYEDIITFFGWRISGTKTMPYYLSVDLISFGLFPLTPWFAFEKISRVITLPDFSVHHTDGNQQGKKKPWPLGRSYVPKIHSRTRLCRCTLSIAALHMGMTVSEIHDLIRFISAWFLSQLVNFLRQRSTLRD
jgi:hypothetical protein